MSFYFTIKTGLRPSAKEIAASLSGPQVMWSEIDRHSVAFYIPHKSFRGAILYINDDYYEVGVNAFTTRADAELARRIAAAIGKLVNADVQPEDSETPLPADMIENYGGEDWVDARYAEGEMLLASSSQQPDNSIMIQGYRRNLMLRNADPDELEGYLNDGVTVQEIDQVEDIFAANVLMANRPAKPRTLLDRILRKPSISDGKLSAFVLTEGVRTLTPPNSDPDYVAILGSKATGLRKVPASAVFYVARAKNCREFGMDSFDITLAGEAYQSLWQIGTPMV